jgi:hypothetical protein
VALAVLASGRAGAEGWPLPQDFGDPHAWHAAASDGVSAALSVAPANGVGRVLKLDFDLAGVAGYATAQRAAPLTFPANFELSFDLRGRAAPNDLQIKFIDASGENVWWATFSDYAFKPEWQHLVIKRRQIRFAWGPVQDHALKSTATFELVVSAGRGGGAGTVEFRDFQLRELPPEPTTHPPPLLHASSELAGAPAAAAADGDPHTAWRSDPKSGPSQYLTIDLRERREFGGLILDWRGEKYASRYEVEVSDDGAEWRRLRRVTAGRGGRAYLCLADSEARFLRLHLLAGPSPGYALSEAAVQDLPFCASPSALFERMAREAPRGYFPRGFSGEQSYWTVVGIDGGADQALLSEDGALEIGRGGCSIEPLLLTDAGLLTWADVAIDHALDERYLPIPSVTWRRPGLSLSITAFARGASGSSRVIVQYELENSSGAARTVSLVLAIRPFQVNPPTQFLNNPGGATRIASLAWGPDALVINGDPRVYPLRQPDQVAAVSFDAGQIPELLAHHALPSTSRVSDDFGYASGALVYRVRLPAGGHAAFALLVPLTRPGSAPAPARSAPDQWVAHERALAAAEWRGKLNRVELRVPKAAAPIADTLRTALAHVLINREGPALHPGARSYRRAWIRDGALTSSALLRLGHEEVARDFLLWYAGKLFANGKVPCCVDARGADTVAENDSPGEFIYLAAEVARFTGDRALLESLWPAIERAAGYLETLRQSERTTANGTDARHKFFGLVPASISHEGYSEKPMHSYWDDFWALRGYVDAVEIAASLGQSAAAQRLSAERDEFRTDLYASIRASVAEHGISYLPGAAELGDFDPTSTSVALAPGGEQARIPGELLQSTFERYWREFVARRDGTQAWDAYTPYELRNVGTFVRLGWRERAEQLLTFFFEGRRPSEWNEWAEVVGRDARQPRFIGDMPHGWVAAEFIRSALDLFAYARESDRSLVIAAGIPRAWLQEGGVSIEGLRTEYGKLGFSLSEQQGRVLLKMTAGLRVPSGGIVFAAPWSTTPRHTTVNGNSASWQGSELVIRELPAEVRIEP